MTVELKSEQYVDGLEFVKDRVEDIFLKYDLTVEDSQNIKAYKSKRGIMVVWRDDTAILKAENREDAKELLKFVPKDSRWTFLTDHSISPLVKEFLERRKDCRREDIYSVNYVTKESFKPLKDKQYEVISLSEDYAPQIAEIWPFARGNVDLVKSFIGKWPAYAILEEGVPSAWASVLLEADKNRLTGMWYTVPSYRGKGRMSHIISKMTEDTLGEGDFLRADIRVDNQPSLNVARSLGFLKKNTYSRLEPI
jgi:hypothetical protein